MDNDKIWKLLSKLDGSGNNNEYAALDELHTLGDRLPSLLHEKYKSSRKWSERASCVYHAIGYSRNNEDAVLLGIDALKDKSKVVRYRACMLLAYSLDKQAIHPLQRVITTSTNKETVADAGAALDAILSKNHHYFVDRSHTGKIRLNLERCDLTKSLSQNAS